MKGVLINVLTRTSNRPNGFSNCHQSIINQTYKQVRHLVSYDNDDDLSYLNNYDIQKVRVHKINSKDEKNSEDKLPAPYNLYCNELLDQVNNGWILFLDDDINLLHNKVLEEIVSEIEKSNEDTLFIWQMRYPNGKVLPSKMYFESKKIELYNIDTSCFLFHSKYKNKVRWDEWKTSDFRFVSELSKIIPNIKWIQKVYIQNNNYGDLGRRNDIETIENQLIFKKNIFWFFLPKYHVKIHDFYIFQTKAYTDFLIKTKKRIKNKIALFFK